MPIANDKELLLSLLRFIRSTLEWFANVPTKADLASLWPEVERRIRRVEDEVESLRTEQDPRWMNLVDVGMTGEALVLKRSVLKLIIQAIDKASQRSMQLERSKRIPCSSGSTISRLFDWLKSALGSLTRVFPMLDFVKEFVEMVELAVRHQRSIPAPPGSILNLSN